MDRAHLSKQLHRIMGRMRCVAPASRRGNTVRNWINKSEAVKVLIEGGRAVGHDCHHWIEDANGKYAGEVRYSLWKILSRTLKLVGNERRPPSPMRYFFWKLVK